jgi:predicted nucleic acid-binding protein
VTTHLADTSVLTRLSVAAVRGALQPFIDAVALARCTLTDLELGFSASSASDWDRLQSVLTTLTPVEVTPAVISRAKNVQRMLATGGLKGRRVPDLIIAAAAELADLTVLHYDHDFELIASVTRQPHEWIVPRGSIDLHHNCRDGRRSCPSACRSARVRQLCAFCSVRVACVAAIFFSAVRTSGTVRSFSGILPMTASSGRSESRFALRPSHAAGTRTNLRPAKTRVELRVELRGFEPLTPSMRTLGGEVARSCWGRSVADSSLSELLAVDDVAVLACCTTARGMILAVVTPQSTICGVGRSQPPVFRDGLGCKSRTWAARDGRARARWERG